MPARGGTHRAGGGDEVVDLPTGLQTMITSQKAMTQAVRDLGSQIVASMDMTARYGGRHGPGQMQAPTPSSGSADPLAGITRGTGGISAGQMPGSGAGMAVEDVRSRALNYMATHNLGGQGVAHARISQAMSNPLAGQVGAGGVPTAGQSRAAAAGIGGGGGSAGGGGGGGAGGGGSGPPGGSGGGGGGGGGTGPAPGLNIGTPGITAALHKLPGVGLVMDAFSEYQSQINKDNYYRNIEGGSQFDAMKERAREEGYTYSSMRLFSNAEARQAFKGVSRMGYNDASNNLMGGQTRADALNFVYAGKQDRGQDVNEGLSQVAAASKSLEVNLGTLGKALDDVSKSAGAAGVNTQMARAQMTGYMTMGIGRGQGAGSVAFASAIAGTNASYGRDYAQTVSSSGIYSNTMEYRAAAQSGMTAGTLRNLERTNPAAAMQAFGNATNQALSAVVTPAMQSYIKDLVTQFGGAAAIKAQPNYADQIAQQFLDRFGGQMDPNAFTNVIQQLSGQDFGGNITLAARWVVEQVAGNSAQANAAATQAQSAKTNLSGVMANGQKNAGITGSLSDVVKGASTTHAFRNDTQSQAAQAYASQAKASSTRDPVIEALLQNSSLKGNAGNNQHVRVMAKGGDRIVTLAEAIKYFPNELAAGKVQFVDGDNAGKSVSDLSGGLVDSSRNYSAESTSATGAGIGMAAKDYQAQDYKAMLGLTPEASKLVTLLGPGYSGPAAAGGVPPTNPNGVGSR